MLGLLNSPETLIIYTIALFTAVTVHEFSHAYMADHLGDPTPRIQGRITLNPLVHLDPFGLLFLLFFGFGWGKPVQFDPFNLKNPRRDSALISLAGPFSNFVLAVILSFIVRFYSFSLLVPIIQLNVILGIFNLLPIAPLDGFKVVGGFLSHEKAHEWYSLERYGILFLLLLLIPIGGSNMLSSILLPLVRLVLNALLPQGTLL